MHRTTKYLVLGLLAVSGPVLAQPSITKIQNNYSYTYPGSPNYGIAPGSLFIVAGMNLAPSTQSASLASGLPATLNGVSVSVKVNSVAAGAYLYCTYASGSASQLGVVLPSNVPAGTGTLTVTNGTPSANAPIVVVQTAVGLDTLSGVGTGRAVAQDAAGNRSLPPTPRIPARASSCGAPPSGPTRKTTITAIRKNRTT